MANPQPNQPRPAAQIPLPPGRTALVSMFPLRLDDPAPTDRHARQPQPAQSRPEPMTGGK
jgi:hypothetical protein